MPVPPKPHKDLHKDPRWRALHDKKRRCAACGELHPGLFDLACAKPEHWDGAEDYVSNAVAADSEHFLSEDFCVIEGRDYFVRAVLQLPIMGGDEEDVFGFGVWSTVSPKNFQLYADTFDSGAQGELGPWFGWFSNRLKGYPDTLNLKCQLHPQAKRQRPFVALEPTDHPLSVEQREGISLDRILALYTLNGHDLGL